MRHGQCQSVRWPELPAALLPQCRDAAPEVGTEHRRELLEDLNWAVRSELKTSRRVGRSTSRWHVQIAPVGCQERLPRSRCRCRTEPASDRETVEKRSPWNPITP